MERRAIVVRGIVQGVGFRPFVYNLADRLHLCGFVKNQTGSVLIEVEGEPSALECFLTELATQPPTLTHIEHLSWEQQAPRGDPQFQIASSEADRTSPVYLSSDMATCAECLAEMLDPQNRRCGYPFLNCTNCGPRLTIITGSPYDRPRTTMASFPMCDACRAEYEDPRNRRFHAQPTACSVCGPRLQVLDAAGQPISTENPLAHFAQALRDGQIGALKGLGGYHLACAAANASVVAELRRRKQRDEKPFAIMVPDAASAATLCEVGPAERTLLQSPQSPIVLLRKRWPSSWPPSRRGVAMGGRGSCRAAQGSAGAWCGSAGASPSHPAVRQGPNTGPVAEEVAPRNPCLGVMLPYTPLHHHLLREVGGMPLVMTSGNRSDEPIAYQDDAPAKLAGIADLFLVHNRPIHVRCDDSVTRVVDGIEMPVRRSRGYAPRPVKLPFPCPQPLLAVGGQLKGTFALGRDRQAFLSHHLGDLDHFDAYRAFEKDVALYQELFAVTPQVLVHDLHPDYVTTRYARERTAREGTRLLSVQHHHAHMASCMAEHGLTGPVLGVTFDGTGYGMDGAVWGGEFLIGDYQQFRRGAHLRYVGMPGGDQAIREPWRMAMAHLADAQTQFAPLEARLLPVEVRTVARMLARRFNTPLTSSVGRLFDAVAALAGVRDRVSYEGQAAVELEALATGVVPDGVYPFGLRSPHDGALADAPLVVDTRPLIQAVAEEAAKGVSAARIARRFHSTLVDLVAAVCGQLRQATAIGTVVLSGGVFVNALLTSEVRVRLAGDGFRVYRHRLVPPNDGGLSLGQLAVAAASPEVATRGL
jgi:hydrogenase maturation protein HypF